MEAQDYEAFVRDVEVLGDRRWSLIPVPRGSKNPGRSGWQQQRITHEHLRSSFPAISNVGVLLGEPSGGLIDIDLDSAEARILAPSMLPPTGCRSGRAGAPASHWFYRVTDAIKTVQFRDPGQPRSGDRSMLVELRSTGTQTLVPPSVHPSGESLTWDATGEPAEVAATDLDQHVRRLAAVSLLVRHWPEAGARHDAALALAGGLLRSGWNEHQIAETMRAVVAAVGDEEGDDRFKAVGSTVRAKQAGRQFTGWTHLATLLDDKVVRRAREWLGGPASGNADVADEQEYSRRASAARSPLKDSESSQATRIAELARDAGFVPFRDPDGEPYCLVPFNGHVETWPINAGKFKLHLSRIYFAACDKVPGGQMLNDARNMLEGEARFEGPVSPVAVRIAFHEGSLYLDMGNDAWDVIAITPSGWGVMAADAVPVRFRRPTGLGVLPCPDANGKIEELRELLNLGDDDDFLLLIGWVLSVLYPRGPQPVLQLLGEQGSAKSSAARLLRSLVDPNTLPLRAAPKDQDELLIAARNSAIIAYDNLSSVPRWLSDALCRLATGGGLSKRELYTDADEVLLNARRPALLTGITDIATASDLLDRCITVTLPPIPSAQRRSERDLAAIIARAQPRVLGALLNAAVIGLQRVDTLVLDRAPRLADFATWVEACAPGLGWEPNHFVDVFTQNRMTADAIAIEATAIGPAILTFMTERSSWEGTASDLLAALKAVVPEATTKEPDWPKRANRVSSQLRRLAPNLRQLGIDFRQKRGSQGRRLMALTRSDAARDPGPLAMRCRHPGERPVTDHDAPSSAPRKRCYACGNTTFAEDGICLVCHPRPIAVQEQDQ